MISFPNAKINIGLNVISKRADGFHDIDSIFYPIHLHDVLEIVKNEDQNSEKIIFSSSGIEIPGNSPNNLCVKAFNVLDEKHNLPSIKIHLHKVIPIGAGLGGGSSDGAFAINMLDELFDLKLELSEKLSYASQLGSDCSFFIENKSAYASGRGEILQEIDLNLNDHRIILINPNIQVNTADAYLGMVPKLREELLKDIISSIIKKWKTDIGNDFEESVFAKYPDISSIKNQLYEAGALYASMSGSGSSVFGIFEKGIPKLNFPPDYLVVKV
ncbi:MAG: 4-(cytidine 5'-diphospho)-2-C-methyl-D-erythritol kinase [Bacteroidetes bacterium]|nr:4-(cytidine 5'-diphospho)-2-C-methyl-D-erythritol kinase [Bacteroidia bacterium]PCH68519.1 MAG: 4-(cytidine 5'-diphospho)-2-C-methyl-D-erythritol kinase [Bacteroidota bacterium]